MDTEDLKKADLPYARQAAALAKLCKKQLTLGFDCNPSQIMILDGERLYYMGEYILDAQLLEFGAAPLMLSKSSMLQRFATPDKSILFSHAVLVRLPTEEEEKEQLQVLTEPLEPGHHLGCLELLKYEEEDRNTIRFSQTGFKEFYVH